MYKSGIAEVDMKKISVFATLIISVSAILQLLLIIYKHYIGYVPIVSAVHFIVMLLSGTFLSSLMMALIVFIDLKIIYALERRLSLNGTISRRVSIELFVSFFVGVAGGLFLTMISYLLFGYKQPLYEVILTNSLIAAVINLLIVAAIEAVLYYRKNQESQLKAEILERENVNMRFEMLKKQLDPHFLFNSLNVLSSLIRRDKKKSQEFIDAFSHVYRYTLDVIDKPVISLAEEIEFARAYMFLQKLRFEDAFVFDISIDESCFDQLIPPLALQILLENAFKHNTATRKKPLNIKISGKKNSNSIVVRNNIQHKVRLKYSRGIGLENLRNRYQLISEILPEVQSAGNEYIVRLPLLNSD